MDELKQLVSIVNRNKIKQASFISRETDKNTQLYQFYEKIAEGSFADEDEAADYFFEKNEYQRFYFNRLKRELKSRLYNSLFVIDLSKSNYTDIMRAYANCNKNLAIVNILVSQLAVAPAISLAKKTLRPAEYFGFPAIVIGLCRALSAHYSQREGNLQMFEFYNEKIDRYQEALQAEILAERLYNRIATHYSIYHTPDKSLGDILDAPLRKLKAACKKYVCYRLQLYTNVLLSTRHEINNNYNAVIKACEEALQFYEENPHLSSLTTKYIFYLKMLNCNRLLRKYEDAERVAKEALRFIPEGSSIWFQIMEHLNILYLHTENYQKAYENSWTVFNNPKLKRLSAAQMERWRIHEAFIKYLLDQQMIKDTMEWKRRFRLSRFLNQVPIYSKDKRGVNVTIHIIQILFLLSEKKYEEIADRMESLKAYSNRYLKNDHTYRSNAFIKMALILPTVNFNKKAVIRKAEKYYQQLKEVPLHKARQGYDVEIIPYETLWELLINSLDDGFH